MSTSNITASRHQFAGWDEAQEYYLENRLTDGLPVVPPTLEKVEAMLEYVGMAPDELAENQWRMLALASELKERLSSVRYGSRSQSVELHQCRGKLTYRQRIDSLMNSDTTFLELSPVAVWEIYDDQISTAGIVTGIGVIPSKEIVVVANDATVKGDDRKYVLRAFNIF